MSNLDKIITYINSMDPIGREAIIMELKDLHDMDCTYFDNPDRFNQEYGNTFDDFYRRSEKIEAKISELTGIQHVPIWQIIYCEMFGCF